MTVEERARSAAADLRTSVAREVSAPAGRDRLTRRVRTRRLEHAGLAVVGVVVAVAVGVVVTSPDPAASLPATAPTIDPTAQPATDCVFTVSCVEGVYRAALTVPTTFSPGSVVQVVSDAPAVLELAGSDRLQGLAVVASPQATDPTPGSGDDGGASPGTDSAAELAAWLTGRRDLVVLNQGSRRVAGRDGVQVDLSISTLPGRDPGCVSTDRACRPLFGVSAPAGDRGVVWLARDEQVRVLLVEVPGEGTVAVLIRTSSGGVDALDRATAALDPVLASLAFGLG